MAIDGRGMFLTCKFAIEAMGPDGGSAIAIAGGAGDYGTLRSAPCFPASTPGSGKTRRS